MTTAKAPALDEIFAYFGWATAWLARKVGLMERASTRAALKARLLGQVLVDLGQLLKKLDVGKESVAHCGQSEVVGNRRLPQKERLFKFFAGVTPPPSALRDQNGVQILQVG